MSCRTRHLGPLMVFSLMGCGEPGGGGGPQWIEVTVTAPSIEIQGTAIDKYVSDMGIEMSPVDLTTETIEALVLEGAGAWSRIPASTTVDGKFAIAGVPEGPFVLRHNKTYIFTSARELDLGQYKSGRKPAVYPTAPTFLVHNINNLSPLKDDDSMEVYVANSGAYNYNGWTANPPMTGDTVLNGATLEWTPDLPLIDKNEGDVLTISQVSTISPPGASITVQAPARLVSFDNIVLNDGDSYVLEGDFQGVAWDQSISVKVDGTEFAHLVAMVNPGATETERSIYIGTAPGDETHAWPYISATLAFITLPIDALLQDHGSIAYGNPYPSSWVTKASFGAAYSVAYTAPFANTPITRRATAGYSTSPSKLGAATITPSIWPVESPMINEKSAFEPQIGVGRTPILSWRRPTFGTAAWYQITINALRDNEGATKSTRVASLLTTETTVTIPEGILEIDKNGAISYWFQINACAGTGYDIAKPYEDISEQVYAPVMTAPIIP